VPENSSFAFSSVFLDKTPPVDPRVDEMIQLGKKLHDSAIISGIGGRISFRTKMGFVSSPGGVALDAMTKETVVEVRGVVFGLNRPSIYAKGAVAPPAETLLHSDIYEASPAVNAVIYISAPAIVSAAEKSGIPTTGKELPAGSQEQAEAAGNFAAGNKNINCFIVKNQAVVFLGASLAEAGKLAEEIAPKATAAKPVKTHKK
jgi:ribulose-5-phosphate 4-epimerase/fuculose-1-phosphate aldolase